jgi:hypothetical protein
MQGSLMSLVKSDGPKGPATTLIGDKTISKYRGNHGKIRPF